MIYTKLNYHEFAKEVSEDENGTISYIGAVYLYDYLSLSADDIEFDAVAIRNEWAEFSETELIDEYSHLVRSTTPEDIVRELAQNEGREVVEFSVRGDTRYVVSQ